MRFFIIFLYLVSIKFLLQRNFSMNTPLPSAIPSTNVTLKEDASSSGGPSTTSSNVFKTATGEVTLSLPPSETLNSSSLNSLNQVAFSQIFGETQPFFQESCAHNLVFLSPELVEIEIQLAELLHTLETMETVETQTKEAPQPEVHIHPRHASSTPTLIINKKQVAPSLKETPRSASQKDVSPPTTSSKPAASTSPTVASFSLRQASTLFKLPSPQLSRTQKESDQQGTTKLSTTSTALAEKKHEAICTTKSQESQQNQEHKEHKHKQHQEQQEDNEQEEHQNKKNSQSKITIEESSLNLSISHLRYAADMCQTSQNSQKEKGKTFQKKAPSPMALFTKSPSSGFQPLQTPKIENVFISFMQLMARILGQAEAEAHELYLRVKERTDNVDKLTLLLSKINAEKGAINWEKDSEMKALIDQVKQLGVTIDTTTYCWSEEEKKLLKENIQMRKENMEKITQLERTDMQRHLQEVSQCHQARSNVLKLLKELMDTFIYNLRP